MSPTENESDLPAETERIMAVLQEHKDDLLSRPNVVGVAVGFQRKAGLSTQNLALVVMVENKIPPSSLAPEELIPTSLEGVPVDVQEFGPLTAQ